MKILFVHQNFPGQYRHLVLKLVKDPRCQVVALGEEKNVKTLPRIPGLKLYGYPMPARSASHTHSYLRRLEEAVRRGQAVVKACVTLGNKGFVPDVVYVHPGWGEALFIRDAFPQARITLYCEFYHHASGHDVGFDPELPAGFETALRVRVNNAASLLSLEACDNAISPTRWQRNTFPAAFRDRIAVVHEGIDTDLVRPAPDAKLVLKDRGVTLTRRDEVVTYVARNLEPYRGFHVFMRALPEIQKRRPRAHVVIVGGDEVSYSPPPPKGRTDRQKMLDEVGGRLDLSRVHFLGQVPYRTLVQIYQVSAAHVYLTYPFVLSWSVLEAMSAGCAVVASRTAPVEEVISDGANGHLVDFFDTAGLAARVDETLDADTAALRAQARRTIVERYDLSRICLPRHLELLGLGNSQETRAPAPAGSSDQARTG